MRKKGFGIQYYLLIFAFFVGLGFFFVSKFTQANKFEGYIGDHNFKILKAANKAEGTLLFIGQSAKYSLQQAVYELAQNGGISEFGVEDIDSGETLVSETSSNANQNNVCGEYYGYDLWYGLKKDESTNTKISCFDENDLAINLEYIFNENLNQYLINHPHNIPLDNYDYESQGSLEIIGKAIEPLKFDILKDESNQIDKEVFRTPEGLMDFTGTGLCAKGSKCVLTEDAYKLLQESQKKANGKDGKLSLEVYSAYRTPKEQQALWEGRTAERYAQRYPNELERAMYVCNPFNGEKACPHMTGNVVDVRFKGKTTQSMTWQDWRLLHEIMSEAGWIRYVREGWHFECCGTVRYAKAKTQGVTEIA